MRNGEGRDARENRLKAEGRFDEFNARVAELKSGASGKTETQLAYWRTVAEFPPLSDNGGPGAGVNAAVFDGKPASTRASAIRWVADSLAVAGIGPADAPSPDAAALMRWVRRSPANEANFWQKMFTMVLPTRAEISAEARREDPAFEKFQKTMFQASVKKIEKAGADATESWWTGLHSTLISHPDRWRQLKAHIDSEIERRQDDDTVAVTVPPDNEDHDDDYDDAA